MNICETLICRYYRSLPEKSIFTTRECLKFGENRGQVDWVMYSLVKSGEIIRLARGVFTCAIYGNPQPTDLELATVKAKSFGKTILYHCADEASRLGLNVQPNINSTYIINGCSSSFRRWGQNVKIVFRTASPKKMRLKNTTAGKVVRSLWHVGDWNLTQKAINTACRVLGRTERETILLSSEWMPWWLSDVFKEGNLRNSA